MIKETLDQYARASGKIWSVDRSQTIGASEIGQCARKVYFSKNEGDHVFGVPRNDDYEDGWGAKERGKIYEDHFWAPALKARFGDRLLFSGSEQRTFISGYLSATPDGLIIGLTDEERAAFKISDNSTCVDLDCKTADPRSNLAEAKPEHVYQVQTQIGLIRELTNHRPTHGVLSYTNASFWDDVTEFTVKFDVAVFEHAKDRAAHIMTAHGPGELKPEGYIAGGRECDLCPFSAACGKLRADRVPSSTDEPDPLTVEHVATLSRRIKSLKAQSDSASTEAKELEEELRDVLAKAGTRKVAGNDFSVSWAALKGRPSWDMKGIREAAASAGVDLSLFETTGDPSDRLTITLKN